jgi:hypothetical protein
MYVNASYKTGTNTQALRNELEQMIKAKTTDPGARIVLRRIFKETNRLTLFKPGVSFAKVMEKVRFDPLLAAHVKRIYSIYMAEYRNSASGAAKDFCKAVLVHPNSEPWLTWMGHVWFRNDIVNTSDIIKCQCCDTKTLRIEVHNVRTTPSNMSAQAVWCRDCLGKHAFFCSVSRTTFDRRTCHYLETAEGEPFCQEYCVQQGMAEQDEHGYWHLLNRTPQQLPGYHGSARPWRDRHANTQIPMKAIGVELECGFKKEGDLQRFLNKNMRSGGRILNLPFGIERDGSLGNVTGGCEIISDPLEFHAGYVADDAPWRKLLKLLHDSGGQGWVNRQYAGIHVNMDIRHVTKDDVFKFVVFISNCAALSKFIAGRKQLYGHGGTDAALLKTKMYSGGYKERKAAEFKGLTDIDQLMVRLGTGSKHSPILLRSGGQCLEVRIFGSNIKYEGFMSCVEYCVAAMEYVQTIETHEVFNPILSTLFRHWLVTRIKEYPNLCNRIGLTEEHNTEGAFKTKLQPVKEIA